MARLLPFIVLAFLVWLAVRFVRGNRSSGAGRDDARPVSTRVAPEAIEQCAWCGVHAPSGTAVSLPDGRVYCSDAHRDQARLAAAPPVRAGSDS